jgi:hypothetical protein
VPEELVSLSKGPICIVNQLLDAFQLVRILLEMDPDVFGGLSAQDSYMELLFRLESLVLIHHLSLPEYWRVAGKLKNQISSRPIEKNLLWLERVFILGK